MNEMKPEDVIKALELCVEGTSEACLKCAWRLTPYPSCKAVVEGKALALIRDYRNQISILKALLERCETQFAEKDAEIERLTQERDDARRDCAVAEQLHYECKKELEEMSDDILDSVRAERDRYKAESQQYQSAFLKATMDAEKERFQCKNICEPTYKNLLETARADAITEFAERLKTFYKHLPGNTVGGSVEYHIDQVVKEMREKL